MHSFTNIKEAKVVMLGSSTVGKTTIVKRLITNAFEQTTSATIGAALVTKSIHVDDIIIKLQIWDTGGSERYRAVAPMYFRDADAAVIVYDITQKSSFEDVETWLRDLREKGPGNIIIALVGNKTDLPMREVSVAEGNRFAATNHLDIFKEASAFSGENINSLFDDLAALIGNGNFNVRRPSMDITIQPQEQKCC